MPTFRWFRGRSEPVHPKAQKIVPPEIANLGPLETDKGWQCRDCAQYIPSDKWGDAACPNCGYLWGEIPDGFKKPIEPPPPPPLLILCTALGRGVICVDHAHKGRCYHDMDVEVLRREGKVEYIDINRAITLAEGAHGFVMPVFKNTPGVTICACGKPIVAGECLAGCKS